MMALFLLQYQQALQCRDNLNFKFNRMLNSQFWSGLCSINERHGEDRAEDGCDCRTVGT